MRSEIKGGLAILAAAAGYSTLPILVKLALAAGARIWAIVAWRFLIGAALAWLFVGLGRRPLPPRKRVPGLLALGLVYSGDAIAYLIGLQWVPAATATLVFFTYPALVVVLAALFLGERLTLRRAAALGCTVGGCMLTAGAGLHGGKPAGIALILVGVLLISIFVLASHPILRGLPPHASTAVTLSGTAVLTLITALATGGLRLGGGPEAAALVGLVALLATALPITLFLVGIQHVGPARAAIFSTVEPAFTVALAALWLHERISGGQWLGGALIVAGVLWLRTERPLPRAERPVPLESP